MKKNFQSFIEKRLCQTVVENFRKESIVSEPGSNHDDRIKELISQGLDTAIREYESEHTDRSDAQGRPSSSRTSTDSGETIKTATPDEPRAHMGSGPSTACSRSIENSEKDDKSSLLGNSLSKASSDPGHSSYEPVPTTPLTTDILSSIDLATAGIGEFAEDSSFGLTNEHSQQWHSSDSLIAGLVLPGVDPLMDLPPALSDGATCDDLSSVSNGNLYHYQNFPFSFGCGWQETPTTDDDCGIARGYESWPRT